MKTAISIPEKVYHSAENLAKRLGISRSQLYTAAVNAYLDRYEGQQITERLNALYELEDSALPSDLSRLQAATLLREQW